MEFQTFAAFYVIKTCQLKAAYYRPPAGFLTTFKCYSYWHFYLYESSIMFRKENIWTVDNTAYIANDGFHNHTFTSADILAQENDVYYIVTTKQQRQATRGKGAGVAVPNRQTWTCQHYLCKVNYKDCPIFQGQSPSLSLVPGLCDDKQQGRSLQTLNVSIRCFLQYWIYISILQISKMEHLCTLTHCLAQDVHVFLRFSQNHTLRFSRKIWWFFRTGKANRSKQAKSQQNEKLILI